MLVEILTSIHPTQNFKQYSYDDLKTLCFSILENINDNNYQTLISKLASFIRSNKHVFKLEDSDIGIISRTTKEIKELESKLSSIRIKCLKEQDPLKTDGLIFTPKYTHYIVGSWNSCGNKLYKWKPTSYSTIDVKLIQSDDLSGNKYTLFYDQIVKNSIKTNELTYNNRKCIIKNTKETIYPNKIYEVIPSLHNQKEIVFEIVRLRDDKSKTNAYNTITSLLDSFILGNENILNNISKLVYFNNTGIDLLDKKEVDTIVESFSESRKQKLLTYITNNYFNKNDLTLLQTFINQKLSEKKDSPIEQEIEARITFKSKVDISCFFHKKIENKYINKIYLNNNYRIIFDKIGSEIIIESVMHKATINKIVANNFNKLYKYTNTTINNSTETLYNDYELTDENINSTKELLGQIFGIDFLEVDFLNILKDFRSFFDIISFLITPFGKNGINANKFTKNLTISYQVQTRYKHFSNYWLIEYIEYGVSNNSIDEARSYLEQNYYIYDKDKTKEENERQKYQHKLFRIEIEFKPFYELLDKMKEGFLLYSEMKINNEQFFNYFMKTFSNENLFNEILNDIFNFKKYENVLINKLLESTTNTTNEAIFELNNLLFKILYTYDDN